MPIAISIGRCAGAAALDQIVENDRCNVPILVVPDHRFVDVAQNAVGLIHIDRIAVETQHHVDALARAVIADFLLDFLIHGVINFCFASKEFLALQLNLDAQDRLRAGRFLLPSLCSRACPCG